MFKKVLLILGILVLSYSLVFAITTTIEVGTDEIPIGPAKESTLTSIKTAVETIDNAISGNEMQVDIITMPATNDAGIALISAARTATTSSADLTNSNKNGVHIILDVTAIGVAPRIILRIEGKEPVSAKYYTILTGAVVTSVRTVVYKVFPGATAVANSVVNDTIPKTFRIVVTHLNTNTITYSVGYNLM